MGNHRTPVQSRSDNAIRKFRIRFYSTVKKKPYNTTMAVKVDPRAPSVRAPYPEDLLAGLQRQPYVHDTVVVFTHNNTRYRFRLFWTQHKKLPENPSLPRIGCNPGYRGEIFVMRVGVGPMNERHDFTVVNLRFNDANAADTIVRRFVNDHLAQDRPPRYKQVTVYR